MDINELKAELESKKLFMISYEEINTIRKQLIYTAEMFAKTYRHAKPANLFKSGMDKRNEFESSLIFPQNYYSFRLFDVAIEVRLIKNYFSQALNLERKDYYVVNIYGWIPTEKGVFDRKGFWKCGQKVIIKEKWCYWNPTTDLEEAVHNYLIAVKDYLANIGMKFGKQLEMDYGM